MRQERTYAKLFMGSLLDSADWVRVCQGVFFASSLLGYYVHYAIIRVEMDIDMDMYLFASEFCCA